MAQETYVQGASGNSVGVKQEPLPLELYRQIFIHSSEAIAIISTDGLYLEQNAAHQRLLGYTDEEIFGSTPAMHMGAEAFNLIAQQLAATGMYRGETESRAKDGRVLNIELSAFAMRDGSGE